MGVGAAERLLLSSFREGKIFFASNFFYLERYIRCSVKRWDAIRIIKKENIEVIVLLEWMSVLCS